MASTLSPFFVKQLQVAERQIAGWSRQRKVSLAGVLRRADSELTNHASDLVYLVLKDSEIPQLDQERLPSLIHWISTGSQPEKSAEVRERLLEMLERD